MELIIGFGSTVRVATVDVRNDVAVSGNDLPAESRVVQESSKPSLNKAIADLSQYAQSINRDIEFTVDKDLHKTIITVYDSGTDEVIRKIPSDEVIALARHLGEKNNNVLLNLKV